MNQKIQK